MLADQNKKLLILSDGKPGHLNQSIAFARHLGFRYDVVEVAFRNRLSKLISYVADACGLRIKALLDLGEVEGEFAAVVSAGSETYYANKLLAKRLGVKTVAIMLPQGYRYTFDLIIAQQHDDPPLRDNIISLPINLTCAEPQGLVVPQDDRQIVSFIVGGDSKRGQLDVGNLKEQLSQVFSLFPAAVFWLTTSRRTSPEVEEMLREFDWDYALFYAQQKENPIADFLKYSDTVFLTADSSSMISEAVSSGRANIEILGAPGEDFHSGKLGKMMQRLWSDQCLHAFDGKLGGANHKVRLAPLLAEAMRSNFFETD